MSNLTNPKNPSKAVLDLVRSNPRVSLLADSSDDNPVFYVDLLGDYGPTVRLFFSVQAEDEIIGRVAIIEGMEK